MTSLSFIKPLSYLLFSAAIFFLIYTMMSGSKKLALSEKDKDDDFEIPEESRFIIAFKPFYQLFNPLIKWLPIPGYKTRMNKYAVTAGLEDQVNGNDMIGFQCTIMLVFVFCGFIYFDSTVSIFLAAIAGLAYPYLWLYEKKKIFN